VLLALALARFLVAERGAQKAKGYSYNTISKKRKEKKASNYV
jgi:hypothetical protein